MFNRSYKKQIKLFDKEIETKRKVLWQYLKDLDYYHNNPKDDGEKRRALWEQTWTAYSKEYDEFMDLMKREQDFINTKGFRKVRA